MATQPTPNLFLTGWNKLPDELKLQVLRHAVPSYKDMTCNSFGTQSNDAHLSWAAILPFLACPPIAEMALEALYTQNRLLFVRSLAKLFLPPLRLRKYARTWWAYLNVKQLYTKGFRQLAAAFPNTRLAELHITGREDVSRKPRRRARFRKALVSMDIVRVAAWRLLVTYWPPRLRADFSKHIIVPDGLEDVALEKLSIVGEQDRVRYVCQRQLMERRDVGTASAHKPMYKPVGVMDKWPEVAHSAAEKGVRRRAVKIMWIR